MNTSEKAEELYSKYYKGYSYILKDKLKIRELAMNCAILDAGDDKLLLNELLTMCYYLNLKIK